MKRFIYKDNSSGTFLVCKEDYRDVVFSCEAENVLEADKKFQAHLGKNPTKMSHISLTDITPCPKPEMNDWGGAKVW